GTAPAHPAPHTLAGRPRRAAHPPATRRPPPTPHPRRRLSPEDQQQRTRRADRPAPAEAVHPRRPRRRTGRRLPLRHRQRRPRNPAPPGTRRPHPTPGAHRSPPPHRPPHRRNSQPRHTNNLILYGSYGADSVG